VFELCNLRLARSLPPFELFDSASTDGALGFDTHEFTDHLFVVSVVHEVELSLEHVFELRVIQELAGEVVASSFLVVDHPYTFDIEVGLFSKDAHTGKASARVLRVTSLHESLEQVNEFVVNLSFVTIFVVFEVPVREGVVEFLRLEHLLGLSNTFTSHILKVDEESLVVVEDEIGLDELVAFNLLRSRQEGREEG
jgi:hypothetical protein